MSNTETQKAKTAPVNTAPAFKFEVTKRVTLPLIKPKIDEPVFVRIDEPMFLGKKMDSGKSKDMEAAHLANVTDLQTGEQGQMIISAVILGIFADDYPEDSYVGKCFQFIKHAKSSDKKYHPFTVCEISVG